MMRANDAVSGILLILLSAAMIALTASFPDFPGQKYGPALFPRILGAGLIVCGGLLTFKGIIARRAGAPWIELAPWAHEPWRLGSFLLMLGMLLLYILASESVGFIPISFIFLGALFLWLGARPLIATITAVTTTIAIHWFFSTLLRVPLPRGWLNSIL
jgi:putative tricarboxylic transport membrane protein